MLDAGGVLAGTAWALVFLAILSWAAYADAQRRIIPNASVAALAVWGLVGHALRRLGMALPFLPSLSACVITSAALFCACLVFETVWRAAHKGSSGMGLGDIKLMGVAGLALGAWVLPCLVAACLSAVLIETLRHNRTFAFGPYLCACFAVCLIYLAVSN